MIVNKYGGGSGGSGERGPQGYQGPEGPQGPQGANGQNGIDGQTGPQGVEGAQGPQGIEGQVGPQGPQGPAGGGQGGDNTILKSTSGMPIDIEEGDVYAVHTDATQTDYGTTWTDTQSTTPYWGDDWHDSPQAIRVESDAKDGHKFDIFFNCSNWGTGEGISIDSNDHLDLNTYTWLKIEDNKWVFNDSNWLPYLDGAEFIAEYDGTYIYLYTTDVEKVWFNYVTSNDLGVNVYTGEITPEQPAKNYVYQAIEDASGNTVGDLLAKDADLQAMQPRLMPNTTSDGAIPLYSQYTPGWTTTNRGAIVADGMREAYSYEQPSDGQPMALVRTDYWGCGWERTFKMVKCTQSDYDNMQEHDENTIYIIVENNS